MSTLYVREHPLGLGLTHNGFPGNTGQIIHLFDCPPFRQGVSTSAMQMMFRAFPFA